MSKPRKSLSARSPILAALAVLAALTAFAAGPALAEHGEDAQGETAASKEAEGKKAESKKEVVMRASPNSLFSSAVRVGDVVFLSGQLGLKPDTREFAGPGVEDQTNQALENIKAILEEIGLGLDDVAKCTVFLADIADYDAMNVVYRTFFSEDPPARSTVAVSGLALGARTEIECIAAAR